MSAINATLLEVAKRNHYFITDATDNAAGNAKFDSTTDQTYAVPASTRWYFFGGVVNRDANETLTIYLQDSSTNNILQLASEAAGTGITAFPTTASTGNFVLPIVMDAGDIIQITFGGAQGAAAYASCYVLEVYFG